MSRSSNFGYGLYVVWSDGLRDLVTGGMHLLYGMPTPDARPLTVTDKS